MSNQLTDEAFAQEFEARFTNYTGLVHKPFNREIHIIPDFIPPREWRRLRGWDFGSAHPTASIRIAIDGDSNWYVEYCYKEANKRMDDHAQLIKLLKTKTVTSERSSPVLAVRQPGSGLTS